MSTKKPKVIEFRRKLEKRTDYKVRLKLLASGRIRLVFRRFNKMIVGQLVEYQEEGDKILAHVNSTELKKLGWNYSCSNMPACYLCGLLLGVKGKKAKVTDAILDIGMHHSLAGSTIFSFVKGVVDAGIEVPVSDEALPPEERIRGKHIKDFAEKKMDIKNQFVGYEKKKADPKKIPEEFEKIKKKIMS